MTVKSQHHIDSQLIDQLLNGYQKPEDIIGENGLLKQLTKAILERALGAELTHHLGYEKHSNEGDNTGNSRNGYSSKTIKGEFGELALDVPRDRNSSFEPLIVPKGETRFSGFDDKIISLYSRGLTTRDIQAHLKEIYQVEVSASLISDVTDAVIEEVKLWQTRPLDDLYPIVYLDALVIKVRESGATHKKSIYVVLGVDVSGLKHVLGLWVAHTEGAKFWMQVVTDLKNRGVKDIFIACVDGLKGFPEAIEAVFPRTDVQMCIVHQVRNSLNYVSWRDRKAVAADLKAIYQAPTLMKAEMSLEEFAGKWSQKYPTIEQSWRRNWERLTPFFTYPEEIRKAIYTTNAVESLNRSLRKVSKTRGAFPNDESAIKLLYLAIRNASQKWTMPIRNWKGALNQFAILFEERMGEEYR